MREKSVSSFKFLSKEKQNRAKTPNEEEEEENEREKSVVQMNWITQILGLFTHHVGMPNNIHELFRFFIFRPAEFFVHIFFSPCRLWFVVRSCARWHCDHSNRFIYYEWAGLTNKTFFSQNLLSTEYIFRLSSISFSFSSSSLIRCKSHAHPYDNRIFGIDNENI